MAGKAVAEAFVTLRPKLDGFADETKQFFDGAGTKLAAATAVASTAVAGFGAAAVTAFASFERGMNEVSTLLPTFTDKQIGDLQQQVLALSRDLGVLPSEVVPALYQSLSAGVPPDNVMSFLELSFKGATAGAAGLETAVDALTSVVNAYGAQTIDAGRASDVIFTTVRLGKTDFEQLGQTLFNVIPTAASLGVSFEEVGAAMATMTARGVPTSVATTQLRALMVELSRDTTRLSQAFRDVSGKSFSEFIAAGGTLSGAMNIMRETIPDDEFRNLFSSVEAANAALLISGPNADAMAAALAEMQGSAGATDAAFERMNRGVGRSWDRIKASTSVAMITVGAAIAPVAELVLGFVADKLPAAINKGVELLDRVRQGLEPFRAVMEGRIVPAVVAVATAMQDALRPVVERMAAFWREHGDQLRGPVAGAIGGVLVAAFGALAIAAGAAAVSMVAAAAPVLAIVAAAAAAGAAVWFLVSRWDDLTARIPLLAQLEETAVGVFRQVADLVTGTLVPALRDIANWIQTYIVPALLWFGGVLLEYVVPVLEQVAVFILQHVIPTYVQLNVLIIEGLVAGFRMLAGFIGDTVVPVVAQMWEWFSEYIMPALASVAAFISDTMVPVIAGFIEGTWNVLAAAFAAVVGFITDTMAPAFGAIAGVITGTVVPGFRALWSLFADRLVPVIAGFVSWFIEQQMEGWRVLWRILTEDVLPVFMRLWELIRDNLLPPVRELIGRVADGLTGAFRTAQTAISNIMGFIQSLIDKVKTLIDKIRDLIGWVDKIPSPGDIGGAIGGAVGKLNPFAEGGAVRAGQLTLVGERGPEVFVPNTAGRIIPNDELQGMGGLTLNINAPVTIQNIGDDRDHERVLADLAFATAAELRARGVV